MSCGTCSPAPAPPPPPAPLPTPPPPAPPSRCCRNLKVSGYFPISGIYERSLVHDWYGNPRWHSLMGDQQNPSGSGYALVFDVTYQLWRIAPAGLLSDIDDHTAFARACPGMPATECPTQIGCWLIYNPESTAFVPAREVCLYEDCFTVTCISPPRPPAPPGGYAPDPPLPPFYHIEAGEGVAGEVDTLAWWEVMLFCISISLIIVPTLLCLFLNCALCRSRARPMSGMLSTSSSVEMTPATGAPNPFQAEGDALPLAQTVQQEPDMSSISAAPMPADTEAIQTLFPSLAPPALGQIKLLSVEKLTTLTITAGKAKTCQILANPSSSNGAEGLFEKVEPTSANFAYIVCAEASPFAQDVQSFSSMLVHANHARTTHVFVGAWCNPRVHAADDPRASADLEVLRQRRLKYEDQLAYALKFASCMIWLPSSQDCFSGMASLEASSVLARQLPVYAASPLTAEQLKLQRFGEFVPWPCGIDIVTRRLRLLNFATSLALLINIALLCGCAFGLPCVRCNPFVIKHVREALEKRGYVWDQDMEESVCSEHQERLWMYPVFGLMFALTWPLTFGKDLLGEYLLARQAKSVLAIMTGRFTHPTSRPQIATRLSGNLSWTRLQDEGDALTFSRVMASVQEHAGQKLAAIDESAVALSAYVAALISGSAQGGQSIHTWMGERGLQSCTTSSQDAISLAQLDGCRWSNGKANGPYAMAMIFALICLSGASIALLTPGTLSPGFLTVAVTTVIWTSLAAVVVCCGCLDGLFHHWRSQRTTRGVLLHSPVGTVELRGAEATISSAHLHRHECTRPEIGFVSPFIYLMFPLESYLGIWSPGLAGPISSSFIFVRQLIDAFEMCAFGIELWRLKRRNAVFELPTVVGSYGLGSILWAWIWIYALNYPTMSKMGMFGPLQKAVAQAAEIKSKPLSVSEMIVACVACMKWAYVSVLVATPTRHISNRFGRAYLWSGSAAHRDKDLRILLS